MKRLRTSVGLASEGAEDRINAVNLGESRRFLWHIVLVVAVGVAFDWHCGFGWLEGRYSLFSAPVLYKTGLIVAGCSAAAALAVCLIRRAGWRDACYFFCLFSLFTWHWLWADWITNR